MRPMSPALVPNPVMKVPRLTTMRMARAAWKAFSQGYVIGKGVENQSLLEFSGTYKSVSGEPTPYRVEIIVSDRYGGPKAVKGLALLGASADTDRGVIKVYLNGKVNLEREAQNLGLPIDRIARYFLEEVNAALAHEFTHLMDKSLVYAPTYTVRPWAGDMALKIFKAFSEKHVPGVGVPEGEVASFLSPRVPKKGGGTMQIQVFVVAVAPAPGAKAGGRFIKSATPGKTRSGDKPALALTMDPKQLEIRYPDREPVKMWYLVLGMELMKAFYGMGALRESESVIYPNDPSEVRAFLQMLWLELRDPDVKARHERAAARNLPVSDIIDDAMSTSEVMKMWGARLNDENRRRFQREIADAYQEAKDRVAKRSRGGAAT